MVDGIGSGGGALGREAIRAALEAQTRAAEKVRSQVEGSAAPAGGGAATEGIDFSEALRDGLEAVNAQIAEAERLPEDFVSGEVQDFHEIAVQLKQADIGFRFALEIRNKLIDAYREVMRMSV